MYKVDTRPHNSGRQRPSYSHQRHRKISSRGSPYRYILEGRSTINKDATRMIYMHANKGYKSREITSTFMHSFMRG